MSDLFNFMQRGAAAQKAADEAIAQVTGHNKVWFKSALGLIAKIPAGDIYTGEQIRLLLSHTVLFDEPGDPHAWGALINAAVRKGLLTPTGRYVPMKQKKSHGRKTPEYRRTTDAPPDLTSTNS